MHKRDAGVTPNALLNKMVQNPIVALRFAILEHWRVTGSKGLAVSCRTAMWRTPRGVRFHPRAAAPRWTIIF